ncbi:MAG: cupin domain-containing protein [Granulosicoccus sp.]|nr:cupin domain-containing protein [Granulosicoccus sp.]
MKGMFLLARDTPQELLYWGGLRWLSRPPTTASSQLTVIEVVLQPGKGHDFHKHPDQEEVIYVISGQVQQWLEQEQQLLNPGDSLFIPADTVHASFNTGATPATLLAILGPCVGEEGYELVDVAAESPWNRLRE